MSRLVLRRAVGRGLSLVEMMVGIAVGLFVVAAASTLLVSQLGDNRRLLLETQIQQDLRAAADIIVRDLRRSLYWRDSVQGVANGGAAQVTANPRAVPAVSGLAGERQVLHYYDREVTGNVNSFGFQLDTSTGVIRSRMPSGNWQDLTDGAVMRVTAFDIDADRTGSADNDTALVLPCPKLCPDGTGDCWPRVQVTQLLVTITARAVADPTFVRTVSAGVRLRNDRLNIAGVAGGDPYKCPE
jgi:type IV pilus assembly protein PilW